MSIASQASLDESSQVGAQHHRPVWGGLTEGSTDEVLKHLAGLPSTVTDTDEVAEPLVHGEAVQAADWVLLANPDQLGVEYNAHLFAQRVELARTLGWQ